VEIGVNGSHMSGSHHMLFEGNDTFNMDSDNTHGNPARSRAAGPPTPPGTHWERATMKRAFVHAAPRLAALAPVIASAVAVQSNLAIAAASPPRQRGGSLLPPDRNASANWSSAGLLSIGGIPARRTVCAMVRPLGSGQDDTTDIQNAVNACPLGQVVSLAAGTFTIAERHYL
jgi:hypothetical protein